MESTQTSSRNEFSYKVLNDPIFDYNKLKSERLSKQITQEELAILCGVSVNTISAIECGLFVPRLKLFYKICWVLKLEDYEVLSFPKPLYLTKTKVL